ncbi:thiol:disulfide interchange protein [Croceifilum oryzae]|uniref:Thiol:disulfide interchange protein n=1 Tax=Croceifilum oryzae TaxID=1553429 RepID=A0AAJ1TFL3_9BACL|nr:YjdF family protein [Croceifilum oryzae]MDQ0417614.1 thiol:disulfide interchange protein [Croceifilum oryzae]
MKLKVFHDGQFWIGVVEEVVDDQLRAGKVMFGTEPKDTEILEFVNNEMLVFMEKRKFQLEMKVKEKKINPKRLSRQVSREMQTEGVSAYTHQALQLELQAHKKERKNLTKEAKEALAEKKWELKKNKRKAKHRGH